MTPVSSGRRLAGGNAVSSGLLRFGLVVKYTKAILPPKWKIITRDEYKGVSMKYNVHFNDILDCSPGSRRTLPKTVCGTKHRPEPGIPWPRFTQKS